MKLCAWDGKGRRQIGSDTLERQMGNQLGLGRLDQWKEANSEMIINKDSSSPRQEENHEPGGKWAIYEQVWKRLHSPAGHTKIG